MPKINIDRRARFEPASECLSLEREKTMSVRSETIFLAVQGYRAGTKLPDEAIAIRLRDAFGVMCISEIMQEYRLGKKEHENTKKILAEDWM
jgi:hypothetical protein